MQYARDAKPIALPGDTYLGRGNIYLDYGVFTTMQEVEEYYVNRGNYSDGKPYDFIINRTWDDETNHPHIANRT